MQMQEDKRIDLIGTVLLYAAPIASTAIYGLLKKGDAISVLSNFVIALIIATVYFTFIHVNQNSFYKKIKNPLLYFGCFFLSFVFLGARAGLPLGIFWMLAVVIAALVSGMEVAVVTHVVLMIQYVLLLFPMDKGFYRFAAYILMGIVLALLFSQLKGKEALPYLLLILLACDGVLQCVVYRFNLVEMQSQLMEIFMELAGIFVFVACGYVSLRIRDGAQSSEEEKTDGEPAAELPVKEAGSELAPEGEASAEGQASGPEEAKEVLSLEEERLSRLVEPDFELLKRLETYSAALYEHSKRIGELSWKAAQAIGGDALLARAGGLYHEIGRIEEEEDYIEAGSKLGREYGFPDRLLEVMRQHSTGFELPRSAEAAVVMLCDCIISTSDYLAKSGKREKISDKQLVTSIFQNRLEKGNLEDAGMTVEQIQALKEFYIENTFAEEEEAG